MVTLPPVSSSHTGGRRGGGPEMPPLGPLARGRHGDLRAREGLLALLDERAEVGGRDGDHGVVVGLAELERDGAVGVPVDGRRRRTTPTRGRARPLPPLRSRDDSSSWAVPRCCTPFEGRKGAGVRPDPPRAGGSRRGIEATQAHGGLQPAPAGAGPRCARPPGPVSVAASAAPSPSPESARHRTSVRLAEPLAGQTPGARTRTRIPVRLLRGPCP